MFTELPLRLSFALAERPNDQVQQRGRLEEHPTTQRCHAGPVCCNGWFDGAHYDQAYFLTASSIALLALARSSGIMTG
jgi:hypothetical protein